ncbi:MAG: protogloblin ApPgb [Bacteroidetes bacterium]|nr:MAG: protogloblin ApPgb [Bacteroidota bacterium]
MTIAGYKYGEVPASPVSVPELELLKKTLLWTEEDDRYLRMAAEVLRDPVNEILDLWYGYVGSHAHLVHYFTHRQTGEPIGAYLERVRARFGQWILDLCERPKDATWLAYQHEIGLRHSEKKNQTDGVESVPFVHFRYMVAFIYPITATIRPFLAKKGHSAEEVDKMHQAWFKAVVLTVVLWCRPYVKEGLF